MGYDTLVFCLDGLQRTSRLETDDVFGSSVCTRGDTRERKTKRGNRGGKAERNRRQNGWRQFFLREHLLSNLCFFLKYCASN